MLNVSVLKTNIYKNNNPILKFLTSDQNEPKSLNHTQTLLNLTLINILKKIEINKNNGPKKRRRKLRLKSKAKHSDEKIILHKNPMQFV